MEDRLQPTVELDSDTVRELADRYALGTPRQHERCKAGLINSNYEVVTDRGEYLVRLYSTERSLEQVHFELSTVEHLSSKGFLCQRPMRDVSGELVGHAKDRLVSVLTFLPGRTLRQDELSPDVSRQIGACFAHLQTLLDGFVPKGSKPDADYPLIASLVPEVFSQFQSADAPSALALLESSWAELQPRFRPDRDPRRQVVHGDLYYQNVLFEDGRLTGIIDFDDAYVGSPLLDLALVVMEFATPATNQLDLRLAEPLLMHYGLQRPLRDADAESLAAAMRFLCFKFLGYTLPLTLQRGEHPTANAYFQRLAYLSEPKVAEALSAVALAAARSSR